MNGGMARRDGGGMHASKGKYGLKEWRKRRKGLTREVFW